MVIVRVRGRFALLSAEDGYAQRFTEHTCTASFFAHETFCLVVLLDVTLSTLRRMVSTLVSGSSSSGLTIYSRSASLHPGV